MPADPFFIIEIPGAKLDKAAGARLRKLRRRRMELWRAEPPRRELLSIWQARQQIDLLREGGQDLEDGDAGTFCPCQVFMCPPFGSGRERPECSSRRAQCRAVIPPGACPRLAANHGRPGDMLSVGAESLKS